MSGLVLPGQPPERTIALVGRLEVVFALSSVSLDSGRPLPEGMIRFRASELAAAGYVVARTEIDKAGRVLVRSANANGTPLVYQRPDGSMAEIETFG